jgi:phosphoribosylformylglycinamidine cyclo-ligase
MRARIGPSPDLLGGLGGFGAALELPPGYRQPVLVSATDGVGTKTEIARRLGKLDTIGRDLVAMCADDVVCHGARPLWFLDYIAVGRVDPTEVATLVGGVADGCDEAGCALVGGETAEHPGVMAEDQFDLAGFCVGIVEREQLLDGSASRTGDLVIGLESSGLHANGYSLVRTQLDEGRLDLDDHGEALLMPTRIYAPHVLALLETLTVDGLRIGGIAHITGGGLPGNLPRAVSGDLGVEVRPDAWPVPPVMELIGRLAGLDGPELRATLNGGIGMACVVEPAAAEPALSLFHARGLDAWLIGRVVAADPAGRSRYREVA